MENSKFTNPSLEDLEIMYNKSKEITPNNLNNGFTKKKNREEANKSKIYKSKFKINSLMEDSLFTNMTTPAIFDAIGNNFIKIGVALSAIITAIGYVIEKIKH